ncbi:MAG TPA: hypothetical protein VI462_12565 [Acidimicrobiia bacterium]
MARRSHRNRRLGLAVTGRILRADLPGCSRSPSTAGIPTRRTTPSCWGHAGAARLSARASGGGVDMSSTATARIPHGTATPSVVGLG